jgi:hypothetical protein
MTGCTTPQSMGWGATPRRLGNALRASFLMSLLMSLAASAPRADQVIEGPILDEAAPSEILDGPLPEKAPEGPDDQLPFAPESLQEPSQLNPLSRAPNARALSKNLGRRGLGLPSQGQQRQAALRDDVPQDIAQKIASTKLTCRDVLFGSIETSPDGRSDLLMKKNYVTCFVWLYMNYKKSKGLPVLKNWYAFMEKKVTQDLAELGSVRFAETYSNMFEALRDMAQEYRDDHFRNMTRF